MKSNGMHAECESPFRLEGDLVDAQPVLRRIALRLCGCQCDADDLVQDTLERALRHCNRFDGTNPRAWLATVMRNLFIDRCRAAARRPATVSTEVAQVAATVGEADPEWALISGADLRAAAQQLPEPFRATYHLRAFEKLSYRAIGERLGVSSDTVSSRLRRARLRLRELLARRVIKKQ